MARLCRLWESSSRPQTPMSTCSFRRNSSTIGCMDSVLTTALANQIHGTDRVRHMLATGRWQRPCPRGVVVTHSGPLTTSELDAVALAAAPPDSALAGPTALRLDGFVGLPDEPRFVVAPSGARKGSQKRGVVTHWSSELTDLDIHPSRSPRRTRTARSVVDAAAWCTDSHRARWFVISAIQQGLVRPTDVLDALTRRGPCRHRALIKESAFDAAGGLASLPERDFSLIWRGLGLPPLAHQRRVRRPGGDAYLDAWCEILGFSVEVHGIPHLKVEHWDADLFRTNDIVISRTDLLAFSSYAVRHQRPAVEDQLKRMAAQHGWLEPTDLSTSTALWHRKRRKIGP